MNLGYWLLILIITENCSLICRPAMMNCNYPVIFDYHTLRHGGNVAIHQSQFLLPSHLKFQHMKVTPVTTDNFLMEISKCVAQFLDTAIPKVPCNHFPPIIIQETIIYTFIASSPPFSPSELNPPPFDEEGLFPGTFPHAPSIYDILLELNAAQLYCNRLIEMLQKKSYLADTIDGLRNLKKYLIEFSMFIDKVLQSYIHDSCAHPVVEELKNIKNTLTELISGASIDKIKEVFENGLTASDFDLVTAALGLDGTVSSAMFEIRQGSCNHQTDKYHITDIVCKAVEENCLRYDPVKEIMDILVASGFSNARASILAEKLQQDELSSLQPLTYWVECYLDYMFEYDLFLNSEYTCFPFNSDKVNEWSVAPRTLDNESADEVDGSFAHVHIYNTTDGLDAITRGGVPFPPREVEENVWYHATDHKSAHDILVDGISLKEGRAKQDFSHEDGFYLTPYLGFAKEWALKKGGPSEGAIIVFKHKIDGKAYKGLDLCLEESFDKWKKVVKYYRSGQKSRLFACPKTLVAELEITDFIEGPMSGDQTRCMNADWQPTLKNGDSNQLCIKSKKLAREFSYGIDSVIFLSTNNNYH